MTSGYATIAAKDAQPRTTLRIIGFLFVLVFAVVASIPLGLNGLESRARTIAMEKSMENEIQRERLQFQEAVRLIPQMSEELSGIQKELHLLRMEIQK